MASENKSRILGIQFGMLSPEEIENMSVCEITSRDTYINNKPFLAVFSIQEWVFKILD